MASGRSHAPAECSASPAVGIVVDLQQYEPCQEHANNLRPRLLEFISRTRYAIVADPDRADAVLTGALVNLTNYPIIFDPVSGRATGVQVIATLQLTLTDRTTGKVLFSRSGAEFRERYEISTNPQAYFDESGTAIRRVSRDIARAVVSAILETF